MNAYLLVFVGSGLGGALRHLVNVVMPRVAGTSFPYHTLAVNIVGSFAMGLLAGYFMRGAGDQSWRLFLTTGVLGGFTTFSAFSLDTVRLYQQGAVAPMTAYVVTSVGGSIAALLIALHVTRSAG
jgi:fluoride exporter